MEITNNNNWVAMSDGALVGVVGAFVKHHRLLQNRTQQEVSTAAGINRSTLVQIENGERITLMSLLQVLRVLNLLYVMDAFVVREQLSPLQLAKAEQSKRKRARSGDKRNPNISDW